MGKRGAFFVLFHFLETTRTGNGAVSGRIHRDQQHQNSRTDMNAEWSIATDGMRNLD